MQRSTRGIKLDYANLGDKLSLTTLTCHKCKVRIPDAKDKTFACDNTNKKKKCDAQFCKPCMLKFYPSTSYQSLMDKPGDKCPVCQKLCKCQSC